MRVIKKIVKSNMWIIKYLIIQNKMHPKKNQDKNTSMKWYDPIIQKISLFIGEKEKNQSKREIQRISVSGGLKMKVLNKVKQNTCKNHVKSNN